MDARHEIRDAWRTVERGGLPIAGADRSGPAPSAEELARSVTRLVRAQPGAHREREALAAFVLAWADQWPHTFALALGDEAAHVVAWAEATATDADRRIKLRRIAIEHLAHVL